jgi:lipopolysaccharide/colanic/teichoic acid biosynthesis glycosyltransferase
MPNTPISNYLRNSDAKTARRFREWADGRDLDFDRIVDAVQMVIGMAIVVIVFLAIAVGATISLPGVR